jgi:hypothetical protein
MKCSRSPGTHEWRPIRASRLISSASVTSCDGPMAVTLQPTRRSRSKLSASKATTALRVAAASLPL